MLMENLNKYEAQKKQESAGQEDNTFLGHLGRNASRGFTENAAETFTSSGSPLLDFFAQGGAMRHNLDTAVDLFKKAFASDREKAIRILFYLRDVRGGQGERELFRRCMQWVGEQYPEVFRQVTEYVPEYGRWDDIFFDDEQVFSLIIRQINEDLLSDNPSLLAKWLPTINASSKNTREKARVFAERLGMTEKEYRVTVRRLREKIKTVEEQMSANQWGDIDYGSVPSQASRIYRKAFLRHDEGRYREFIEQAKSGEREIKATTLYPYQLFNDALSGNDSTVEALWNQLPDYTQGKHALVVADTSGSMYGDNAIAVSVSLALYFAERNTGRFKDHFITFSSNPDLQRIEGNTLHERIESIRQADWGMNTDLQAVFDLILATAVHSNTPQSELPSTIYVISDMEFDHCARGYTNFEMIDEKYREAGYTRPNVVFWQVDARSGQNLPVRQHESGVTMVSGYSPSVFRIAVEGKTPEQVMEEVIGSERYARITIEN